MSDELRLGLVGCGRLAERGYLPAIHRARGMRLTALADPVKSRCHDLAAEIPAYGSAAEMVVAGGVDALVLATPAAAHLADARLAAGAGLPVLVEKPPTHDCAEARELVEVEPAPWVGFNRRFDPCIQRLRSKIPKDGPLDLSLELHYRGGAWASYVVSDDALAAIGSHLVDLARWLSRSEVCAVRADCLEAGQARVELRLERGRTWISCATGVPHRDRVEATVGRGQVVAQCVRDGHFRRLLRRLARPTLGDLVALLVGELEEFASASRGEPAPHLATAADGLAVMAVIDAARESAASGSQSRPVSASRAAP